MGDRRQAILVYPDKKAGLPDPGGKTPRIYLYTHWHGEQLPGMLANALREGRGRWDDMTYLGRLIITHIVHQADECLTETGWGLAPSYMDTDYDHDIVIDLVKRTVSIGDKVWTFEEYIKDDSVAMPYFGSP